jgi:hypothetical protein
MLCGKKKNFKFVLPIIGCVLATAGLSAKAQIASGVASVQLNATLKESLTVSATPANVSFNLIAGGTAQGNVPVGITTTWVLNGSRSSVTLSGYFSSSTAALTDGAATPTNIPSSDVLGQVTTGLPTAFTAFTQSAPVGTAGAGLELFKQSISAANRSTTRTDNLNLQINLTGLPQLPAGTYTGTLNLQAQAL